MNPLQKARDIIIGRPLDPLKPSTRRHILLVAFLAWIGLGADGLSSSCYGPEVAYLALGQYTHLGLYLALATTITVFIISLGYNQIIELFPTGGGGYKVATALLHPLAGLVSGTALVVDYILTITISVSSGVDAIFSLLPADYQDLKIYFKALSIVILIFLNLRGIKESILILAPIFLGFVVTHLFLIIYGIWVKVDHLPTLIPETIQETLTLSKQAGWFFVVSLFLRAYSMGGGTYTGIEAVSNNVNILVEPRVKTGKLTMLYMATSLSIVAGGLIVLYLIWNVKPEVGRTLNATTFTHIMQTWQWGQWDVAPFAITLVLLLEAAILFVAANTGILDGPNVLANMAVDYWVPSQFRHLSSRLVIQNGILFMGIASLLILFWTQGDVNILVIMYSINVFITFSFSLFGLTTHWWKNRTFDRKWFSRQFLAFLGFTVCISILGITIFEKFVEGAWITLLTTSALVVIFYFIKQHYVAVDLKLQASIPEENRELSDTRHRPDIDPDAPTAIFFMDKSKGKGMHILTKVLQLFPNVYKNFIFLGITEIDSNVYRKEMTGDNELSLSKNLKYFVEYCHILGLAAEFHERASTDTIEGISKLSEEMKKRYPNAVFFAGEIIFENENWITRWLHNHTATIIQRILHEKGMQMVLLPINIS